MAQWLTAEPFTRRTDRTDCWTRSVFPARRVSVSTSSMWRMGIQPMKLGFNNENPWKFYTYIILLTLSLFQGGNSTEWILRKREWDVDHWKEEFDQWKHHKIRPIGHPTTPYQSGDHALHFTLLLLEPMVKMGTLRDHFIGWWTKREIEPIIYTYNQYIHIINIYIYVHIYIYTRIYI